MLKADYKPEHQGPWSSRRNLYPSKLRQTKHQQQQKKYHHYSPTSIFNFNLAIGDTSELFSNHRRTSKLESQRKNTFLSKKKKKSNLGKTGLSHFNELTHNCTTTVNKINISFWGATVVHKADILFHDRGGHWGTLQKNFVTHVHGSHELENRDLQGKVERGNESTGSVRPTKKIKGSLLKKECHS